MQYTFPVTVLLFNLLPAVSLSSLDSRNLLIFLMKNMILQVVSPLCSGLPIILCSLFPLTIIHT